MRHTKVHKIIACLEVEGMGGLYKWLVQKYHYEQWSSHEIQEYIVLQVPGGFTYDVRTVQRHVKNAMIYYCKPMRSNSEARIIAINKGRMTFEHMRKPIKVKRTRLRDAKRTEILERDGYKCQLCGATAKDDYIEIDHIVPICEGGKHTDDNMRALCRACNVGKRMVNNEI